MNRIVVDKELKEISKIRNDEVTVFVDHDMNLLIDDSSKKKYVFIVQNANLNILCTLENAKEKEYQFNINHANVSFNNVSYNSNDVVIKADLNECASSINIYNSVIALKDITYSININHYKGKTNSYVYNNGVTKDNGSINFDVSSFVKNKAKDCTINQDSKIITLNDTNKNEINPILLIDEYETEAKHAAFIGNFNNKELFYLMSRGLNKLDAQNLLINGLLIGTLDVCFNEKENLRKKLKEDWR